MSREIVLDETISVPRSLRDCFAYVADFAHVEEWDPGVRSAERLTPGPPRTGSEYRVVMKAGFSLHYTVVEFEPQVRVLMDVRSSVFDAREEILFDATDEGTRIRYIARFRPRALLGIAARMAPGMMDAVGKSAMRGLRRALQDAYTAPSDPSRHERCDRLVLPGMFGFTRFGYRKAKRRWKPVSARLDGRHIVLTGATSGIGLAAAHTLAAMGADLTLAGRDGSKLATVVDAVRSSSGNASVRAETADLALMADVNALADRLLSQGRPIAALINNAGALFNPRQETEEGLEKSFALLLLGPFILTERLHPLLAQAGSARVVNVLSGGMYTQRLRVRDLQHTRGTYSGSAAYARAKRGLMILTEEWAARWRAEGIVVNAMHPGWADTPGVESALPAFRRLTRPLLRSPAEGADTVVWLAAATEAAQVSGLFWLDREPHPSHISDKTRESGEDRAALLAALEGFLTEGPVHPDTQRRGRRSKG